MRLRCTRVIKYMLYYKFIDMVNRIVIYLLCNTPQLKIIKMFRR